MDSITVCVVDDSAEFRVATRNLLHALRNLELIGEFATADAALNLCAARTPDLVLVDLRLPSMQGLDFIRRLKHINDDIKIVVTSSHDAAYRRAALTLGADRFIPKSRLATELPNALRTLVSHKSTAHAASLDDRGR